MNPLAPPPGAPRPTRRHRGLRIGLVLLLVATVPVMGIGGLTIHAVRAAQAREDDAMHVGDLASHAVALTELDGAIFEEMVWSVVAEVMSSLDAPAALLTAFLDSDPAAEAADAVARTDELLVVVAHPSITAEVATARTGGLDRREIVGRFGQVASSIEAELTSVLAVLGEAPHGATGAVPRSLAMLRLAVDARVSVAGEFSAYFATVLALRDSGPTELRRLIAAQAAYEDDLTSLQTLAGDVAPLATALRALEKEPDLVAFQEVVDGLVTASLTEGIAEVPAELSVASLSAHVAELRTAYGAATHASRLAVALLDATAAVVLDASRSDEAAAHADIVRWYTLASVLALATTASALLASRYIVRPLRRLHQAAVDLRTGDGADRASLDGPAEVRTAALALRDAAAHVDLVTHQADALASGDLDAAVLDQPAPGGLGVALQLAVSNLRVAIAQQDEFQRRLAHEASHDALTRLPNRNASLAHLARSLARSARGESGLAVLVIDVDRFNEVNDHHGHRGGDVVLATIARRLVTTVREGDHVGRLGGDEFVVVAEPVAGVDEAISLAERIVDAIDHPIALPMAAVHVHASVGIAIADAGLTADELLRDADLAVYRAKEAGQGGIVVCNEDLHAEIAETAGLHLAIRNAIDRDELVVHYQPIVDVHTGRLHALEALVRWRRPGDDRLVPPDRFIGVAERSSLIVDLDCWVVAAVARQLAAWSDDPDLGTVPVAVNVSGRHLAHDHVVDQLLRPLAHAGVAPRRMIVEVTESALVGDLQRAAAKLHELRSAGMQVAIDDFGTGYTSLAHLRCLPVDVLKIDRSFTVNATSGEQGASIVKLIIDAGHLLGATVTAEGIETPDEAARLMELGADHLQGFLFARPMPAADIEALHRDTGHVRG